jgi:spore coat polysaccharide biosynthesis predicted glycosyltransferase SpsG
MRAGFRCDAGPLLGVGHLIRCLALAEELLARGVEVVFIGSVEGSEWARSQLGARGLRLVPAERTPEGLAEQAARRLGLDAVIIDSYALGPEYGEALRDAGLTVLAIVDGEPGQRADLYLDQNLGAEDADVALPPGAVRLAGARFALLRDSVRAHRVPLPRPARTGAPRLLCFFGGTDAAGAAVTVTQLAISTGEPFDATVVAASTETERALNALPLRPGQSVTPIAPTDRLPALAAQADAAVIAAGGSTWEMLGLGVPVALLWVAENQRQAYANVVSRGLAVGLGSLAELSRDPAEARRGLRTLLADADVRAVLAERGAALVDGRGRERVASALLDLSAAPPVRGSV